MTKPRILLSNDDGFRSEGLHALREVLLPDYEVWTVAPERERSAVSQAISLHKPLRLEPWEERAWWCSGTPADCMYVGLEYLLKDTPPDLVVTGINRGLNVAEDVWYSGTVGAAIEAVFHEVPAIAASMDMSGSCDFKAAAGLVSTVVEDVLAHGLPRRTLLNVNLPGQTRPELGWKVTRLGHRDYRRQVTVQRDPRGRDALWLGSETLGSLDVPGSDANTVAEGMASVTPLHLDLTHHGLVDELASWKGGRRRVT